ncbi:DNA-3-methyladenine glycosylase [Arsenophonus nasoniae]|uniref:DNA-3-methyladenine glycosylase n=1 Tax=Arsenophonus nasoniae TaxID=638 RepID=A0AA95KF22_9GAMM|nr:DNA-3-methyladenine glycosylase [Arsenophonus nasoniae]WGM03728.1 DNA-3-methyladenine glycosylase [Arsenophonus nasoniae]
MPRNRAPLPRCSRQRRAYVLSLNGPGKLCKQLTITKNNNQIDLTQSHNFCVYDTTARPEYMATPRIGIKVGTDKLWRFKAI